MPNTTTTNADAILNTLKGLVVPQSDIPESVLALVHMKGTIVSMVTVKACKVRKGEQAITKQSEFNCRMGVNYDNIAAVQEKREDGTLPAENAGLPWGEWAIFPHLIHHKGQFYIRCTTLKGAVRKATFFRGNAEITRDEAKLACLASEFPKHDDEPSDVFTVKVESIVTINGKLVDGFGD